ncbi:MAG: hypothetical protein AAF191_04390, partial [Verrucomicrobiota bacterium]
STHLRRMLSSLPPGRPSFLIGHHMINSEVGWRGAGEFDGDGLWLRRGEGMAYPRPSTGSWERKSRFVA